MHHQRAPKEGGAGPFGAMGARPRLLKYSCTCLGISANTCLASNAGGCCEKSAMKYHIRGTLCKTKLASPTCFGGLKRSLTKVQKTTTTISKDNVASKYRSVICTTVQRLQTLLFEFSCVKL